MFLQLLMNLALNLFTQVGMETAFTTHCLLSCLVMSVIAKFTDWVQQCMVLHTINTLLKQ